MNIKTYFNDRFLNALSRDDVLGGTYTLLYNDLEKRTGRPIHWVVKTENVKRNGSEENKTCPFTHQKTPFYIAKGHLLERKRA